MDFRCGGLVLESLVPKRYEGDLSRAGSLRMRVWSSRSKGPPSTLVVFDAVSPVHGYAIPSYWKRAEDAGPKVIRVISFEKSLVFASLMTRVVPSGCPRGFSERFL